MAKIQISYKSIFDSDADYLVCPVNKVGVMGAGLAKKFKEKYPKCQKTYLRYLGLLKECGYLIDDKVLHLATKDHWKDFSNIEFIEKNLSELISYLIDMCDVKKETKISFPKLGCGCGGLKWDKVKPMMVNQLCRLNDFWTIIIHE